jgi:RNA polymerase sigma-70 factor (family 1)
MPAQNHLQEKLLIDDMRNGSMEAFESLFKLHWHQLYIFAKSRIGSHDEAEDIIQNIFSALWEKRETLMITDLSMYLHTAVKNRIINIIRSRITQRKYWDYYKVFIPQQQNMTEHAVAFGDLQEAVGEAVSMLPEKSREVFKLSRIEGRSNAEIANLMNLSEKAIEYHLTSSLRKLRVHLKDFILILCLAVLG